MLAGTKSTNRQPQRESFDNITEAFETLWRRRRFSTDTDNKRWLDTVRRIELKSKRQNLVWTILRFSQENFWNSHFCGNVDGDDILRCGRSTPITKGETVNTVS